MTDALMVECRPIQQSFWVIQEKRSIIDEGKMDDDIIIHVACHINIHVSCHINSCHVIQESIDG
jgi:hypothetical protein